MNHSSVAGIAAHLLVPVFLMGGCSGDDTSGSTSEGAGNGGAIDVIISGEAIATDGIAFPKSGEIVLVDGWEIRFDHVLVTVDKITLSENPDKNPTDQSQTDSPVAEVLGPWAVDLHVKGSVAGAGGEGKATPITSIDKQNMKGGASLAADQRYAFGYDIVVASSGATKVNLDAEAETAYGEMIAKKYSVLYVGTASFKGGTSCESSDASYDFTTIPTTLKFRLGFATPVTHLNCQNQENQGDPFPGEEYQRGIAIPTNTSATAQMTLHLEHPFFSDVEHGPALFFDQIASRLVGKPDGTAVTVEDFVGVDPTAFTDASGMDLPWRTCDGSVLPSSAQRGFAVGSVPVNPAATPDKGLRDYRDYIHYVQSTQGHLNGGDGLCYVKRNYPSPP